MITSIYIKALESTSPMYYRPDGNGNNYYYQSIAITTVVSSIYTLTSNAYFDAIGYLYATSFDPKNPEMNIVAFNDNCNRITDFCMTTTLDAGQQYVLVVTTAQPFTTERFQISVFGPVLIDFKVILPSPSKTIAQKSIVISESHSYQNIKTYPSVIYC